MAAGPPLSLFTGAPVSRRRYYALSLLPLVAASIAAYCSPVYLARFFTGPDHLLWTGPFLIWMGFASTAGIVCYPWFYSRNPCREAGLAYCLIIILAALFLFVSIQRMAAGLRPAEAYAATMALRFADGGPLFPDPEKWPVGTIYTPFFAMVCGLLYKIIPSIYFCGRFITITATLLSAWFVYKTVLHVSRDKNAALWAAALFFATYAVLKNSYDLIFVDSLCMCFAAAACFHFIRNGPGDMAWSLFLAGLACFTKQSAVLLFPVIGLYMVLRKRSVMAMLVLFFWATVGIAIVYASQGWAWEYLVRIPSRHGFRVPKASLFFILFIMQAPLWIGACIAFVKRRLPGRFALVFGALFASSILGVCKSGGWTTAAFSLEPLLCIAGAGVLRRFPVLLTAQLLCAFYNPFKTLYPWATVHAARKHAVEIARATPGEVWFPVETYLSYEAKKPEWDGYGALESYLWNGPPPPRRLLDAIAGKKFDCIIICTKSEELIWNVNPVITGLVRRNYTRVPDSLLILYRPAQ